MCKTSAAASSALASVRTTPHRAGRSRPSSSCLWASRLHGRRGLAPDSPSSVKTCRARWLSAWLHSDLWPCGCLSGSGFSSRSNVAVNGLARPPGLARSARFPRNRVVAVGSWTVHAMPWLDRRWRTPWVANKQIRGGPSDIRAERQMEMGQFLASAQCLASGLAMGTCGISTKRNPSFGPPSTKPKFQFE